MQYNFVIIKTPKGRGYADKILKSVEWIRENRQPQNEFKTYLLDIGNFYQEISRLNLRPHNTIIHPRAAHPEGAEWISRLQELEDRGFMVVNSVDTITTTADKLRCALLLQDVVPHPKTWEYRKNMSDAELMDLSRDIDNVLGNPEIIIAKPLTSLSQGAHVKQIFQPSIDGIEDFRGRLNEVPGQTILVQEFFPYTAMHRVIVTNGQAIPYTFVDTVARRQSMGLDWKVSCCLNRDSMRLNENPDSEVLDIARRTQEIVGGKVNFIDVFERIIESPGGVFYRREYAISEINTACSLIYHEKLARDAGRRDWNIHARIARLLVREIQNR